MKKRPKITEYRFDQWAGELRDWIAYDRLRGGGKPRGAPLTREAMAAAFGIRSKR